jgi:signal transduction histidine kinase
MNFYSGSLLATSIGSLVLGGFVFFKGKNKLPNITLGLFSLSMALWCFGQFMGEMGETRGVVLFWTREGLAGAIFIPVFFLHFILALTDRAGREAKLLYFVYGLGFLFLALDLTPLFVAGVEPILGFRYYPQAGIVYLFFAPFILFSFAYAFVRLFLSYRDAFGAKKNQLLYVLVAALIGFSGGITTFFPVWGIDFPVISHLTLPLYVLITIYAILKHRLLDISVIVREGLIYSTLTALFAGFYVLAVLVANYYLSQFVQFNPILAIFLVVFVSVLFFQPLRDRVQKVVDQIFFRGEYQYLKTINDLSVENRQLFQSLLRADKLASLGTLSAGMAHEIKNPLASIKGMTQVLDENLDDKEFINKYQDVLVRQIDRINNLIEKMLKLGQSQGLSLRKFQLKQVIDDVLSLLENQYRKKNIKVDLRLSDLPEIEGDLEQLSQVFMNLFLNAIQAMDEGGALTIKARLQGPTSINVEVSDTGIGIPAEKLDRIFDPFFSLKERGSGMGLAVVYRIIKEHKGEINVESELGKGTKFTLWLSIKAKRSV